MSDYRVYLKVKPFIKEWLHYHFGNPVVFPAQSVENSTIRLFLTKQPENVIPRLIPEDDEVAICIPDSKGKPVATYNYLGPRGKKAVEECIEDTFKVQLWSELNDLHNCGCTILKAIDAWCENNGISIDHDYTIKMRYQRMRDSYRKSGVDMRKKRLRHDDISF